MSPHTTQPSPGPHMTATPATETGQDSLVRGASEAFVKGAAKQGGQEAVKYEQEYGQQQLEDAKAQAQGMWAKYCGCLSGAA